MSGIAADYRDLNMCARAVWTETPSAMACAERRSSQSEGLRPLGQKRDCTGSSEPQNQDKVLTTSPTVDFWQPGPTRRVSCVRAFPLRMDAVSFPAPDVPARFRMRPGTMPAASVPIAPMVQMRPRAATAVPR